MPTTSNPFSITSKASALKSALATLAASAHAVRVQQSATLDTAARGPNQLAAYSGAGRKLILRAALESLSVDERAAVNKYALTSAVNAHSVVCAVLVAGDALSKEPEPLDDHAANVHAVCSRVGLSVEQACDAGFPSMPRNSMLLKLVAPAPEPKPAKKATAKKATAKRAAPKRKASK